MKRREHRKFSLPAGMLILLILGSSLTGCRTSATPSSGILQLEEHTLSTPPDAETGAFQPVSGSQDEFLARHAGERASVYQKTVTGQGGNPALQAIGEESSLVAVVYPSTENPPAQVVAVTLAGTPVFTAGAGLPSPVVPLQGLWSYGGHWALEILSSDESTWAGQIYLDGDLINQREGYDEAFGFQLLAGKPFFFFHRDGQLGYSFDGLETDLDYDQIPHYRCCGESALNPVQAQDMVAFFAQRGEDWYYVELGDFDSR